MNGSREALQGLAADGLVTDGAEGAPLQNDARKGRRKRRLRPSGRTQQALKGLAYLHTKLAASSVLPVPL